MPLNSTVDLWYFFYKKKVESALKKKDIRLFGSVGQYIPHQVKILKINSDMK